jgi:serine/threonine protein kinase
MGVSGAMTTRLEQAIERFGPGSRVGPYQLCRLIGQGGSSHVYFAEDGVLGRQVAVKIASHPDRYAECESEFDSQARAIGSRIDHPAIVRIYGAGLQDGVPYLAMEYEEGETLLVMLSRRLRLYWHEALSIARDVAEGLAAAHRLSVLHRDVKPENILVTREGRAKLTDFYAENRETLRNEQGTFDYFGTPGYSAPEQVRGQEEMIDARSDLFALGVVMYEMLEGRPFHGHGVTARLIARTLSRVGLPRLKAKNGIPVHTAKLVNQLVQANPRRRPSDAVAVLEMIDRSLARQ